ncbi:MAG: PLP-dependent aminotransferase family protein [Pseudomonadales bacterium]
MSEKNNTQSQLRNQLRKKWAGRDLSEVVNDVTLQLMDDTGDWDPPLGITPKRELIRLAIGIPDSQTVPKEEFLSATAETITRPGEAAFIYGFGAGYARLRAQLAERYSRDRGIAVDKDWFQLTNGSAGAIDLICRTLINPGDVIIAESPTYMGTLRNFRGVQAEIASVPMDEDGMLIDELSSLVDDLKSQGKRIKFIYTISTFQNPTGATLSESRRQALLQLAADHNILILDDDAYGELYFGNKPLGTLSGALSGTLSGMSGGHGVLTVGTFSKTLATGLRIGWIHGEPELVSLFGQMRFAMGLNQIMVRMVSNYMSDGVLDKHTAYIRGLYYKKMTILADALEQRASKHLYFSRPGGGFYLWVGLNNLNEDDVWRTAWEEGVAVTPGKNFFVDRSGENGEHIRIAYPWTPIEQLEEGARRIGIACERVAVGDVALRRG